MLKEILRYVYVIIFSAILIGIMAYVMLINKEDKKEVDTLVIFGENTDLDDAHRPFLEDGCIYVAFSTFYKTVDKNLFYDEIAEKIIITNKDSVAKIKLNSNIINVNLKDKELKHEAKKIGNVVFLPLSDIVEFYDITLSYNEENKIVTISKKEENTSKIKYNKVNVYEDINTSSKVMETLNLNDDVIVYEEALKHNRWIKLKTMSGNVGYIFKQNVDVANNVPNIDENKPNENSEKYVMFWQYGSTLNGLGDRIDGVNVAAPTAYELSNEQGNVSGVLTIGYIDRAHSYGYQVWGVVNNGIDNANYSSKATSVVMNSEVARENLIRNILNIVDRDNLDGINIDFEAMKTDDRDLFTQFIRELAPLMRERGKVLSVDTYFTTYLDRTKIGEAADYVVLMGYDQNGAWSEVSGSVSSLEWVENNILSLMNDSNIPHNKIILGVPFYTRLWTEKQGESKPTTVIYTISQAANYINRNAIDLTYDEKTGQNYFEYTRGNVTYKMWVEDATSMKNRVDIVNKYNLAGISAWRKGFETDDIWPAIVSNIQYLQFN